MNLCWLPQIYALSPRISLDSGESQSGDPKFYKNGDFKPFYGLSTIAKLNPTDQLAEDLHQIQERLKVKLKEILGVSTDAELNAFVRFLPKNSFHMTIADIDPSADYNPGKKPFVDVISSQFARRYYELLDAYSAIAVPGEIRGTVQEILMIDVSKLVDRKSVVIGAKIEFDKQNTDKIHGIESARTIQNPMSGLSPGI